MMNRKQKLYSILAISAAALTLGAAQAQDKAAGAPGRPAATPAATAPAPSPATSQWLSLRQIYDRLEADGYTRIVEIEQDDGGYEARATDPQGRRTKLYIDPRTGDVLRTKIKRR